MVKGRYTNVSDPVLLQRVADREEGAFNELYHRYGRKMLMYFYRMLYNDEQLARDFNQDLWLKVVEKSAQFDPKYSAQTWLYTLASNMCKNEYRKRRVRQEAAKELEPSDSPLPMSSTETEIDHATFRSALEEQLKELTHEQRSAFILRYQAQMPIKEIAELLNCAEGTVKSRIFYSLKNLARQLATFGPHTKG